MKVDLVQFTKWLMWWDYNVSHKDKFHAVFGDTCHPDYRAEKIQLFDRGVLYAFSALDNTHRQRLVDAVLTMYGPEKEE